MSKKILLFGAFLVILGGVLGGFFFADKKLSTQDAIDQAVEADTIGLTAWIEVVSGDVFVTTPGNTNKVQLETGDEIEAGARIETTDTGKATIHFQDGSVATLDESSVLLVDRSYFDEESKTLNVKLTLSEGSVWSKILGLLTTESSWEVETSNAVATVRGTAFGVFFDGESTDVVGIENKTLVQPKDPITKEVLKDQIEVTEDTGAEIPLSDIEKIKRGEKKMALVSSSAMMAKDEIKSRKLESFKEKEGNMRREIEAMRADIKDENKVREEFREKKIEEFKDKIRDRRLERVMKKEELPEVLKNLPLEVREELKSAVQNTTDISRDDIENLIEEADFGDELGGIADEFVFEESFFGDTITTKEPQESISVPKTTTTSIQAFKIIPTKEILKVVEGQIIEMKAFVVYGDGTRKDVTLEATWKVIGPIGIIDKPGIMRAKLSPEVSELGQAPGAIVSVWKDPLTGKIFEATTGIFTVYSFVGDVIREG